MSITLEWNPPLNPNGQIMKYIVEYRAVEKRHQVDFTADTPYMNKELRNKTRTTITNLEPTTKYELKISAQNQQFTSDAVVLEVFTEPLRSKKNIYSLRELLLNNLRIVAILNVQLL